MAQRGEVVGEAHTGSGWDVIAITPSNTAELSKEVRQLRATGAGNIAIVMPGSGGAVRICAFLAGETRNLRCIQVMSTNTTCTGIEGVV